jgi:DNA-binding NarL/FixJ family response regulator
VILRCLELGAVTFIVKSEGKSHLIDAVRAALLNEPYVGPRMAKAIFHDRSMGRPKLAPREQEVLIAWFQTESKDLVGQKLEISSTTVRTHLQRVRTKYAAVGRPAPTKSALVARAIQDGIIFLDDL